MSSSPSSSAQAAREQVARRLADLRRDAGLTMQELADRCHWNKAKTSRIEAVRTTPSDADIRAWCHACDAEGQTADLIEASRSAHSMYVEWRRTQRTGLRRGQEASVPLYDRTKLFRIYCVKVLPGLLQTEGYARALLSRIADFRGVPDDSAQAAAARVDRSKVIRDGRHRVVLLIEEDALNSWPNEPAVFERGSTALDRAVTPDVIDHYIDTGCVHADEIALVKSGPSLHPDCHRTNGRTDPAKLHKLYGDGYTIRLGNLQPVVPFLADMARVIQQETGFSNYLHAFLTPPRSQGLLHHWDQQMAVIAQIEGEKRWQLWRPEYSAPMREYQESFRVWSPEFIPKWEAAGPDVEVDLKPGQSLLLPRGWVHNPHALDSDERSVHLTLAIRERTPLWIAEKLIAAAIEDPAFRRVVLPGDLLSTASLANRVQETRQALMAYLEGVDVDQLAPAVRKAAITELEYTT